jgi:hypothetical protein
MALTDTAIKHAKPGNKTRKLYDSGGLYLEVSPKGGTWWRFKYRFSGKEKRLSLGVYPDVSLKDARDRRDDARKLVANAVDPAEHRRAEKATSTEQAANSFEIIAREWFAKHSNNWVASHADRIIRRLERDIFPWIGSEPIATVTCWRRIKTLAADTSDRSVLASVVVHGSLRSVMPHCSSGGAPPVLRILPHPRLNIVIARTRSSRFLSSSAALPNSCC